MSFSDLLQNNVALIPERNSPVTVALIPERNSPVYIAETVNVPKNQS